MPFLRPDIPRLRGKVCVVFGAGSVSTGWGIGKATSVLFARHGASIVAVDSVTAAAEETASIIEAEGGLALSCTADVSSSSDVERAISMTVARFGAVDVLVNNVGIGKIGGPVELSEADWDRVTAVNLKGAFLACKHAIPHMVSRGGGSIISTSSVAALRYVGYPHMVYSTTKAGLLQMSRAIALEYAGNNIRANCVVPGLLDTPRIATTVTGALGVADHEETRARRARQCPMGRMGDAWDAGYAALYLASDESNYVTATEIIVDGGLISRY